MASAIVGVNFGFLGNVEAVDSYKWISGCQLFRFMKRAGLIWINLNQPPDDSTIQ